MKTNWLIGGALFILVATLYIFTRTEVHTFDALSYTQDVENKPLIELYHPHHLLYGAAGRLTVNIAELFGYEGRADQPIQILNALAGALGVVLMWALALKWTGKPILSLFPALTMGFSYAYWLYAGEVEVYTFATLFMVGILCCLPTLGEGFKSSPKKMEWTIILGLLHAGAVMFHQTNILFAIPLGLYLLLENRRGILPYGITLGLAVGIPYLTVGYASGFRDIESYYEWLTGYAQTGTWGGNVSGDGFKALLTGLENTLSPTHFLSYVFYGLVGLGFALNWRGLSKGWRILLVSWLLIYGGFFWWWEPWNIEFWIVLLPLWALGLIFLTDAGGLRATPTALLAGLLLVVNWGHIQENGDLENDYYRLMAEAIQPQLVESDLVVTRGNILDLYLPFYAEHENIISLRELYFGGEDAGNRLLESLEHPFARGQIIFIDAILLDETRNGERNPFGLSAVTIAELEARFPIFEAVEVEGQLAFYSLGERITEPNWVFDKQLNGWLEFGADNLRFENGAWCITGGGDPWIESPTLNLNAEAYPTLKVMILAQDSSGAQFFWARSGEGLDEARSVKWTVDSGLHEYEIDLRKNANWSGEITFLRFDPLGENTTIDACIYRLSLEKE